MRGRDGVEREMAGPFILLLCLVACSHRETRSDEKSSASTASTHTRSADTTTASLPPAANALPDPCTLIRIADAQAILGEEVGEPQRQSLGGTEICDYRSKKLHGGIAPYTVHVAISREQQSAWDAGRKLHEKELRPAPALGDDAYFLLDDLVVRTHGYSIDVGVITAIDAPNHRQATDDAEIAAARRIVPRVS